MDSECGGKSSPHSILSTKNYSYDSDWKDQLVSYNGSSISYDEIGNPLTYLGYTMGWEKGRILSSIAGNGKNLTFSYNSAGLRAKKISGSTTYNYYYAGDVLVAQYDGTSWMKFLYGADGDAAGFTLNGETYLYVKNIQGDVIGILDDTMSQLCSYHYDAWGKCTVYDASGNKSTSSSFIGNINPIRYRGYYYDVETGFYYVSSRYYDPEVGRFISADTTEVLTASTTALTDKNLYAYCDNNPIVRKDVNGDFWDTALDIASIAVGVADVIANPSDVVAWSSLAVDVVCAALPGVTGGGTLLRGIAKTDDVIDAANAMYKASNKASDIRKATGSYEILYKNGTTYVGKGGYKRAINSAKRHSKGTEVSSINWRKASSHRNAYINEYKSMCKYGGPNNRTIANKASHNRIWSPGRKYYYQKYGSYYRYGGKLW